MLILDISLHLMDTQVRGQDLVIFYSQILFYLKLILQICNGTMIS